MRTVYLDQNKWIDLAKARFRQDADPALKRVLESCVGTMRSGAATYPLSPVHYMEVARIGNPRQRSRLGTIMHELSGGHAMASYGSIVEHELSLALAKRFPDLHAGEFAIFGFGFSHAFQMGDSPYRLPPHVRAQIDPSLADWFEDQAQEVIERALLTGSSPDGVLPEKFGLTEHNTLFMKHLNTLPSKLEGLPRHQWHDALVGLVLVDMLDGINRVLRGHNLTWPQLSAMGKSELTTLVAELPTRSIDLHLHWQVVKNPRLVPKPTDLEDWAGLVPAAAYCDVLVCEKHFADLLARDRFKVRAEVLTDLRDLPGLL